MSAEQILSLLTGAGGATGVLIIFVTLLLSDKLHTDAEFRREEAALDREKAAHDETRRALAEASARADAAVHASELIADAFSGKRGTARELGR